MHDLDMDAAGLGDRDRFFDRLQHLVRFVAQVGEVAGVMALDHLAQRDHLRRLWRMSRAAVNRPDDSPSAPASSASSSSAIIALQLVRRRAARSSMPITISRSVLWPTSMPAFTAVAGKVSR